MENLTLRDITHAANNLTQEKTINNWQNKRKKHIKTFVVSHTGYFVVSHTHKRENNAGKN